MYCEGGCRKGEKEKTRCPLKQEKRRIAPTLQSKSELEKIERKAILDLFQRSRTNLEVASELGLEAKKILQMREDYWRLTSQDELTKVWGKYGSKVVMENLDACLDLKVSTRDLDLLKNEIARLTPICRQLAENEKTLLAIVEFITKEKDRFIDGLAKHLVKVENIQDTLGGYKTEPDPSLLRLEMIIEYILIDMVSEFRNLNTAKEKAEKYISSKILAP